MPTLQLDYAEIHRNLGTAFVAKGKLDEAVISYQWALALRPGSAKSHLNLGHAFILQGKLDEAVVSCQRAVALEPGSAEARVMLGRALRQQGKLDEAVIAFRSVIDLEPDNVIAHVALSSLLLTQGRFREGWNELEWRLRMNPRNIPQTLWQGEDLSNRTLLIWAEQGFGDSIHFSRYVNIVRPRGGRIIVEVEKPLFKLFQASFERESVFSTEQERPHFDFHVPIVSLPRLMGTDLNTIPADIPYLQADRLLAQIWKKRLEPFGGAKIGIAWAGDPLHQRDFARSVPFAVFRRALPVSGIDLFSLQVGSHAQDTRAAEDLKIEGISDQFADYADTAAAILNLDLCITVDTSVAHLAGALGRPIWVLIPFSPDSRWLLHREDTPWYPTMRLFRQERPGDWAAVLDRVHAELVRFAAGDRSVLLPGRAGPDGPGIFG
jgi:tetratricopeptide (TPR) repeat protein